MQFSVTRVNSESYSEPVKLRISTSERMPSNEKGENYRPLHPIISLLNQGRSSNAWLGIEPMPADCAG